MIMAAAKGQPIENWNGDEHKDHGDGSDDPIAFGNGITQNRPHDPAQNRPHDPDNKQCEP